MLMNGRLKIAPRQLLLDNRSCVVLIQSFHGHMRCPNKLHPCNDAFSALPTSDLHGWRKCNRIVGTILAMWVVSIKEFKVAL